MQNQSSSFSDLDHQDMLGNIFRFCSMSQLITEMMPVCKRWFQIALEFDNNLFFEKSFYHFDDKFDEFCNSLASQFVTCLTLFKPNLENIEKLINCGSFKKVKILSINNVEDGKENPNAIMQMIANSEIAKNVEHLNIHRFRIEDEGMRIIVNSPYFNNLKVFKTYWNGFTNKGIELLATCPKFSNLTEVEFTDLGTLGFQYICQSPNFSNVTHLDVGQGNFGNEGMEYYASSPYLKQVKSLILDRCNLDAEGIKIMCDSENSVSIEDLQLEYTDIGDEGVKVIAQSPNMKNLTTLDIRRTDSGNLSAEYISKSPYLKNTSIDYEHYYSEDPYYEGKFIDKEGAKLLNNRTNNYE